MTGHNTMEFAHKILWVILDTINNGAKADCYCQSSLISIIRYTVVTTGMCCRVAPNVPKTPKVCCHPTSAELLLSG